MGRGPQQGVPRAWTTQAKAYMVKLCKFYVWYLGKITFYFYPYLKIYIFQKYYSTKRLVVKVV